MNTFYFSLACFSLDLLLQGQCWPPYLRNALVVPPFAVRLSDARGLISVSVAAALATELPKPVLAAGDGIALIWAVSSAADLWHGQWRPGVSSGRQRQSVNNWSS